MTIKTDAASPPTPTGLLVGEPAPWFHAQSLGGNPRYAFDTVAGRAVLMLFFASAQDPDVRQALALVATNRALFDDENGCFFGVTLDPEDAAKGRIAQHLPGIRHFVDSDGAVHEKYRFAQREGQPAEKAFWVVLDPMLRIIGRMPLDQAEIAMKTYAHLARVQPKADNAPVLMVPNLIEPSLCRTLIDLYKQGNPEVSGFMREVGGKTMLQHDRGHKVRKDYTIADPKLIGLLGRLVSMRLAPIIKRAFQFNVTRMERYIVACYEAEDGGHFAAHRDNTTKGTAHRRFAVSINLNSEDYEGGSLCFPEFGPRQYKPPTGGAVVFSCSLLHRAMPVTSGTRYAFLPFLYDEAAAQDRFANNDFLGEGTPVYDLESDRI